MVIQSYPNVHFSFNEFVEQTRKAEFEQDGGWQGLDEQEMYSQQEYEEFERHRQEEIRQLVEAGVVSIGLFVAWYGLSFSFLHCYMIFPF